MGDILIVLGVFLVILGVLEGALFSILIGLGLVYYNIDSEPIPDPMKPEPYIFSEHPLPEPKVPKELKASNCVWVEELEECV